MMTESCLFTRSQAQELTGLDAQTLDYWTRLGVLCPVAGGGGKGHHRKYDRLQVTLGRLLREAEGFGVGGKAMKEMAEKFQAAIEWFAVHGLQDHAAMASSLIAYRHDLETDGQVEIMGSVLLDSEGKRTLDPKKSATQEFGTFKVAKGEWESLLDIHQRMSPLPAAIVEKCMDLSRHEMRIHFDRYMALFGKGPPKSEIYFFKNADGSWEIDFEEQPKKVSSFITIRIGAIKRELWRQP